MTDILLRQDGQVPIDMQTRYQDMGDGSHAQVKAAHLGGWDGAVWRKLPLVWGYSERYIEHEEDIDVAAATHTLDFTVVPVGEVWCITAFSAWCSTNGPSTVSVGVVSGGTFHRFRVSPYGTAYEAVEAPGSFILAEGDFLRARFSACNLNDDIYSDAIGYKMKIAE